MYRGISQIDNSLRNYQQEAKDKIFSSWDECNDVMFQMPTGTGKTRLFTSIIRDISTWGYINNEHISILIVAHRQELVEQISESLSKYRVRHGIIMSGVERDLTRSVQVASIQTLASHANSILASRIGARFVIIDEAHHSRANTYRALWNLYPKSKKLGVTATPWRMNKSGFTDLFQKLILSKPIKYFIEEHWLASYIYYSILPNNNVFKKISSIQDFDIEGDYKVSALESIMMNSYIYARLLDSYLKFAKGKKGIIYSISKKHSEQICDVFRSNGIRIVSIDSSTKKDTRRNYIRQFREGEIKILVNVDIFSEGFDCPDIEFIQLARPTKSLVKYLQQVGRGLRPNNGNQCIILDNVGQYLTFGLPDEDRPWEDSFNGSLVDVDSQRKSDDSELHEKPVSDKIVEGDEELKLIHGETQNLVKWSAEDDDLLKKLMERNIDTALISQIFPSIDRTEIENRIEFLRTNCE